ncbi:MAG TPA: prepilin-type N-terminal cleavage/methylation domain-containing protein [Candidatus Eremiobacteraceae bacterium]|nr:prepilin-type N-terminal cleavage/methylation domain-containing protein [Candidatus Eremiobacteraceae bacterium]
MSSTKLAAKRGFTLVEVMVSSVMAAMFFTMLYGMFLPVLSVSSASSSKADTLSAATTALYQLEADIRVGTTNGITVGSAAATPQPTLGSAAEVTELAVEVPELFANTNDNYGQTVYDSGTGLSDFASYVVYALVSESGGSCDSTHPCDLYRETWPIGSSSTAAQSIELTQPGELATLVGSISTNGRLLARNITSFQIANQTITCGGACPNGPARPEVDLELAQYATDQQGKVSQTSYQTQVFVRNN